jgi:hypothetical protein
MYRIHLIAGFLLIHVFFFCGQNTTIAQTTETITIDNLRELMDSIATETTEGRLTTSAGYKKAAQYAADVFQKAGLQPGFTNEKGEKSYFQPVPFIKKDYSLSTLTFRIKSKNQSFSYKAGDFFFLNAGTNNNIRFSSAFFVGYAINEPEMGWDDFDGLDVEGKWVIVIKGIPPGDANSVFPKYLQQKYSDWKIRDSLQMVALVKHKVAGVIVLPDKNETNDWEYQASRNYRYTCINYAEDEINNDKKNILNFPVLLVSPVLAQIIVNNQVYNPLAGNENYRSFKFDNLKISAVINCKNEQVDCFNIAAIVPGIDPVLKEEYITVCAHLDHIGKTKNHVYNGANDDASGCAALLSATKEVATKPLKRSVIFVLHTAEEIGLIGSRHFLSQCPIAINQITANINIEQIGSKNREYLGVWAIGAPNFNESFLKAGTICSHAEPKFDSIQDYNAFAGQVDSWNYFKRGIPVVMLSSGGFPEHHTFQDNVSLIDFDHLLVASNLLYFFISELGTNYPIN